MTAIEMKNDALARYDQKIKEVNAACNNGTAAEFEKALQELVGVEREYRKLVEKETFNACEDVRAALLKHEFETISHRKVSVDGRQVGVERDTKMVQIDLQRFCEHKGLDTMWYYDMEALNKRLALKVAGDLKIPAEEVKLINDSYTMSKYAKEIELGKTPTSNTQIIKHIQRVLDAVCPGAGKVNNRDLTFILCGYTKCSNKDALRVVLGKHSLLLSLLTKVFHRILTNKNFGLDCKTDKPKAETGAVKPVMAEPVAAEPVAAEPAPEVGVAEAVEEFNADAKGFADEDETAA